MGAVFIQKHDLGPEFTVRRGRRGEMAGGQVNVRTAQMCIQNKVFIVVELGRQNVLLSVVCSSGSG